MNISAVNKFIGSRWEYITNDCWALFAAASKDVFGVSVPSISLPENPSNEENSRECERQISTGSWVLSARPEPGCAVVCRSKSGAFLHIGLYVEGGNVLHCPGTIENPGTTRYESIKILYRIFAELEFYVYAPNNCNT